jgi:hypothetical protein
MAVGGIVVAERGQYVMKAAEKRQRSDYPERGTLSGVGSTEYQAVAHRDLIVGLASRIYFVCPFGFPTLSKKAAELSFSRWARSKELAKFEASDDEAPLRGLRISYFDFFLVPFIFFVAMTLFLGVW